MLNRIAAHLTPPSSYNPPPPMQLKDWGIIFALMLILTIITFTNLGYNFAPQTSWQPTATETAMVDFGEIVEISAFQFYMGHNNNVAFMIAASKDGRSWSTLYYSSSDYSVFQWGRISLDTQARFIEIIPFGVEGLRIQEAAFRDESGRLLLIYYVSSGAEALFDEQHLVPVRSCFMLGTYFDEVHYVRTGYEFLHGLPPGEVTHPPLGKVFQAISIAIFGMTPFAWRLPGALFGLAMIPLIYAFARQLFKSNNWAFFAAFILSFDFMRFVQTRIATIDSYVVFFVIAMYFFMYVYTTGVRHRSFRHSVVLLILCGASMGLAIASKWQGVYAAVGLPILFFPVWFRTFKEDRKQAIATAGICVGAFIALPFLIYTLSYIPFVNSFGASNFNEAVRIFWDNQRFMLWFHGGLEADHIYGSPWWSWPLMLVPFHYYSTSVYGLRQGIVAMGNPTIWWFGIPVTAIALYKLIRLNTTSTIKSCDDAKYALIFLLIGYAMQYLPWIFVSRVIFIYHYFPSVPFVVLLITWFFKSQVKKPLLTVGYCAVVTGLFVLFYPVLSGTPVEHDFVYTWLRWIPGVVWR